MTDHPHIEAVAPRGAIARPPRRLPARVATRFADSRLLGLGLLAPGLIALTALILVPIGYAAGWSLRDWRLTQIDQPKQWVGLQNYNKLIHDDVFFKALKNTGIFVVAAVGIEVVLGFAIALALFHVTRGRRLVNALILLPMILSPVLVALIWRYVYDTQFGPLNIVLNGLGLGRGDWLGDEHLALGSVIFVDIWQFTPFAVLVLHAGLLSVPEEIIEAARVDGANSWNLARHILIPWAVPFVLVIVLIRSIDAYRIFDTIFLLTAGGPGSASESLSTYAQRTGFSLFEMGYSMAMCIVMLVVIAVISVFYLRLLSRGR
jgi:multiple sugar transport system permease protein